MKGFRFLIAILGLACLAACSRSKAGKGGEVPVPVKWNTTQVCPGLAWHSFRGWETVSGMNQVINVLEFDPSDNTLTFEYQYYPAKTTLSSAIRQTEGAIAATNASFGTPHTFIRIDGTTYCDISEADPTDSGNWYKHEAAIWFDGEGQFGVLDCEGDPFGALDVYKKSSYPNLFSSEPLLILNHENVTWVGKVNMTTRSRHPRTAVALTDNNKLLLVTVDGRWYGMAGGMVLTELRDFLRLNFDPSWAINMDGGGSTTMYIDGYGKNGIVNYPCNANGASSGSYAEYEGSFTERELPTFFVIKARTSNVY